MNNGKKIFLVFLSAVLCCSVFAKKKSVLDNTVILDSFNDVDFREFNFTEKFAVYEIGRDAQTYTALRYVFPFKINRYETTYRLWYEVRMWAEENGYYFQNPGQEGSNGSRGKEPSQANRYEPVTMVNWYDVIVWCNAYSQMQGLEPCYYFEVEGEEFLLTDSSDTASCDLALCHAENNGYRLPFEHEWEYAARYTVGGLQSGSLSSGQVDFEGHDDDSIPAGEVAWLSENADGTRRVGTAGTPFIVSAPPAPGSGNPNGAGIFDMTGNVLEWCFDWFADYDFVENGTFFKGPEFGAERVMRGASWNEWTMFNGSGDRYSFDPNEAYNYFGFRIVCKM